MRRIGIIGAGFSGTAMAAELYRLAENPIEIFLFDKSGYFGTGAAYNTPYAFHLLNVRSKDMSLFEDDPRHFVNWLKESGNAQTYLEKEQQVGEQFAPRMLYATYLKDLLNTMLANESGKVKLKLISAEVIDMTLADHSSGQSAKLMLSDHSEIEVDKVVLAVGNGTPAVFPFPVSKEVKCINNPWDYTALNQIDRDAPVLIVGTGLSMIDAVLTLNQQKHEAPIYAVSRHGLLPLPHTQTDKPAVSDDARLPQSLRDLCKHLRATIEAHANEGGDWRSVIAALRLKLPAMWAGASLTDKKRFLRHLMPYWNVHRHRVHHQINNMLVNLAAKGQLKVLKGRIVSVTKDSAMVRERHASTLTEIKVTWLINCMGPGMDIGIAHRPLAECIVERGYAGFDELKLGFMVTPTCALQDAKGVPSSVLYSLGPPTKGMFWESTAVPDIRKQSLILAKALLAS